MKTILKFTIFLACFVSFGQNNLLDNFPAWALGTGSTSGFSRNGTDAENVREQGINPHGDNDILWKAVPDADNNADGGWNGSYLAIDPNKTYRLSVWIKKTGNTNGRTYFGMNSLNASSTHTTLLLDGTERSNAYFWNGDLPELDKWYLLIGFVHQSAYGGTTATGGVYDGTTGLKVLNAQQDFKFRSDANRLRHRSYLYYNTDVNNRQYFWGPTLYEVNGQEPAISELLNPSTTPDGGDTVWNTSGNDINYTAGKVGIGTDTPSNTLTVSGADLAESTLLIRNTSYSSTDTEGTASLKFGFANHFGPVVEATKFSTNISGLNFYGEYGFNTPQLAMTIKPTSVGPHVGIGTDSPDEALTVKGKIHTQEIIVDLQGAVAPDYVFYDNYNLKTLEEVQKHIDEHGHLPNIPSAKRMEQEGLYLKEMNLKLLEKIEELTLYILEQNRKQQQLEQRINQLEEQN